MANNVDIAWNFLRSKGLSPAQAAGVIGVMQGESGPHLDPKALNPSSGAFGIGQWLGGRKTALQRRPNSSSIHTQLEHLWGELQGPERAAFRKLKGAHTIDQAVNAWLFGFERPGANEANLGVRTQNARRVFSSLSGKPVPSSGSGSGGGSAGIPGTPPTTTTIPGITQTVPDPAAEKRVILANYLQKQNPRSPLLSLGVVSLTEPTTKTETTPDQTITTPGTPGISGGRGSRSGSTVPLTGALKGGKSPLFELIHKGGPGYAVKNGQVVNGPQVFSSVWDGHADHVHVAAGPRTIVRLGKIAQEKFGLHVGENPHFGGVSPVHVSGSYHYKGEAIDVSGNPQQMNRYAAYVERVFGLHG